MATMPSRGPLRHLAQLSWHGMARNLRFTHALAHRAAFSWRPSGRHPRGLAVTSPVSGGPLRHGRRNKRSVAHPGAAADRDLPVCSGPPGSPETGVARHGHAVTLIIALAVLTSLARHEPAAHCGFLTLGRSPEPTHLCLGPCRGRAPCGRGPGTAGRHVTPSRRPRFLPSHQRLAIRQMPRAYGGRHSKRNQPAVAISGGARGRRGVCCR
jgi:hypothetical protein